MKRPITLSLDVMGGDHGPHVVIPAAERFSLRRPDARFVLVGDEALMTPLLAHNKRVAARAQIIHTDVAVKMDDKPSQALRNGRWKSSMWLALEAVKKGEADACISAGNTGALMAMSKFCLKSMPGIERPAIAAIWPTLRTESIVLDVGATIGADAAHLVDMALMGTAMARALFDRDEITVGLLNIGVEEVKGLEPIREAGQILKSTPVPGLVYKGFVEGDDLGKGEVDVIVTEGFAGNIALKTAEGTAKQVASYLRTAMRRTLLTRLGAVIAGTAFRALKMKLDPRKMNGGVFLGLNGIVIKSHGGADDFGFASAIDLGYDMVKHDFLSKVADDVAQAKLHKAVARDPGAQTSFSLPPCGGGLGWAVQQEDMSPTDLAALRALSPAPPQGGSEDEVRAYNELAARRRPE